MNQTHFAKCPECGTTSVEFLGRDKKAWSWAKAIIGGILLFGIGILFGLLGTQGKFNYRCKKCGLHFKTK